MVFQSFFYWRIAHHMKAWVISVLFGDLSQSRCSCVVTNAFGLLRKCWVRVRIRSESNKKLQSFMLFPIFWFLEKKHCHCIPSVFSYSLAGSVPRTGEIVLNLIGIIHSLMEFAFQPSGSGGLGDGDICSWILFCACGRELLPAKFHGCFFDFPGFQVCFWNSSPSPTCF